MFLINNTQPVALDRNVQTDSDDVMIYKRNKSYPKSSDAYSSNQLAIIQLNAL